MVEHYVNSDAGPYNYTRRQNFHLDMPSPLLVADLIVADLSVRCDFDQFRYERRAAAAKYLPPPARAANIR